MGVIFPLLKHLSLQKDVRPALYDTFHMPEWFHRHGIPHSVGQATWVSQQLNWIIRWKLKGELLFWGVYLYIYIHLGPSTHCTNGVTLPGDKKNNANVCFDSHFYIMNLIFVYHFWFCWPLFFLDKWAAAFYWFNNCSVQIMGLMNSGGSLNQHDPWSCSADLARTCAALLHKRFTCLKEQDKNFVVLNLMS
jgi:hypothetical protein